MADQQPEATTERLRQVMREGFTLMLGAANWAYEQGDRLVVTWMEQGKTTREDSRRRFEEFANRTRKSADDWRRGASERMRAAASSMSGPSREQVASLERRVEELTRQIEELKSTRRQATSSEPGRKTSG